MSISTNASRELDFNNNLRVIEELEISLADALLADPDSALFSSIETPEDLEAMSSREKFDFYVLRQKQALLKEDDEHIMACREEALLCKIDLSSNPVIKHDPEMTQLTEGSRTPVSDILASDLIDDLLTQAESIHLMSQKKSMIDSLVDIYLYETNYYSELLAMGIDERFAQAERLEQAFALNEKDTARETVAHLASNLAIDELIMMNLIPADSHYSALSLGSDEVGQPVLTVVQTGLTTEDDPSLGANQFHVYSSQNGALSVTSYSHVMGETDSQPELKGPLPVNPEEQALVYKCLGTLTRTYFELADLDNVALQQRIASIIY